MRPIKMKRYIANSDQWIPVQVYGFVAVQGVTLMGTDASKVHAVYVRDQGVGILEHDNIENFKIGEE